MKDEFERFKAWQRGQDTFATESDSDASPPRVVPATKHRKKKSVMVVDPITDSSSSEDEDNQPMVLVYRRDSNDLKYRSYEPARHG